MCDVKAFGKLSKAEKMELLEAWLDGKKIEHMVRADLWVDSGRPTWAQYCAYRIKPKPASTKPSIDWSAVSEKFKYLAKDDEGSLYLYTHKPEPLGYVWRSRVCRAVSAEQFASASHGTCDWKDSLVKRPEGDK
jgi:hypothetical protein